MENLKINSYARQTAGSDYCSAVETYASNLIEDTDAEASIIFPGPNLYATMRSPDYRLVTDSAYMMLPLGIEKIKKVLIYPNGLKTKAGFSLERYVDENNQPCRYIDITKFVVEDKEWNGLPKDVTLEQLVAQSSTLFYTRGDDKIWVSARQTKRGIFNNIPTYYTMLAAVFNSEFGEKYIRDRFENIAESYKRSLKDDGVLESSLSPVAWLFQIEYIPVTPSTKVRAEKAESLPTEYAQLVNQRAETASATAFGKYLHETAQKTGTETIAVAKTYKRLADVIPVGAVVKHNGETYRCVSNTWNVRNPITFTVTHSLSKNWSNKSKHVAVDQKYRNWEIPFDEYIWRTLHYNEYVIVSDDGNKDGADTHGFLGQTPYTAMAQLFRLESSNMQLRHMFIGKGGKDEFRGVVAVTTATAIGQSLLFSAKMQDNMSAGLRFNNDSLYDENKDEVYLEDVLYCNDDGTLETAEVYLANGIYNHDSNAFPFCGKRKDNATGEERVINSPMNNAKYTRTLYIDKDPGEALKLTFQFHFIPSKPWIIIGSKLLQNHPFVNSDGPLRFRILLLKDYIRDGVDKIEFNEATDEFVQCGPTGVLDCIEVLDEGRGIKLKDAAFGGEDVSSYKAWAITDIEYNLYLGCNDVSKRSIYFTWRNYKEDKS